METIESLKKECRSCKVEKPEQEFYFVNSKNRYMIDCKSCYSTKRKSSTKRYCEKNKEKIAERQRLHGIKNREKNRAYSKEYHAKNREQGLLYRRERYKTYDRDKELEKRKTWYQNNKQRHADNRTKYEKENKDKLRAARRKWENNRLATDINYKLHKTLAGRIRFELKGVAKKSSKTEQLIGCSIEELRVFIESHFLEGMSWGNYGTNGWHIDHRIPVSWFNLENENCRKIAFSYKNLQPLWGEDNLKKKNFYHHKLAS